MDTQIRDNQRGAIRVSDAERDQAVAELSEHYQAGRLTLEEFDDRSDRALQARTGSDLVTLFADLPTSVVPAAMSQAATARPVPVDIGGPGAGGPLIARAVIACVIAAIVLGNVAGHIHHHNVAWVVPVVILGLVFLRLGRHR